MIFKVLELYLRLLESCGMNEINNAHIYTLYQSDR